MKKSFFYISIASVFLLMSCTDEDSIPTYEYRIINSSGQNLKIEAFIRLNATNEINQAGVYEIHKDDSLVFFRNNEQGYVYPFGNSRIDSVIVVFQSPLKFLYYTCKNGNHEIGCDSENNMIGSKAYSEISNNIFLFELTEEDYNRAADL